MLTVLGWIALIAAVIYFFYKEILILLGIAIVIGLIAFAIDVWISSKPNGGGRYSSSSSSTRTTTSNTSSSSRSSNDSGSSSSYSYFYKGSMASGYVTGTYKNGQIFKGLENGTTGFAFVKASYTSGYIYKGTITGLGGRVIGRYEYGRLYRGNSTRHDDIVATYKNGRIYRGHSTYDVIGRYEGDDEGGAATAFYFLFYDD